MATTLLGTQTMLPSQYIIVKVAPDMKTYTAWVVNPQSDHQAFANGVPVEPIEATRTSTAATLGTDIANTLPTLTS